MRDRQWNWMPGSERWREEKHGLPENPHFLSFTTKPFISTQAYDFWCESVATDFEFEPPTRDQRLSFRARAAGLAWRQADFFDTRSDAISGFRSQRHIEADGLDSLSIGFIVEGARVTEDNSGQETRTTAGQFFVYDGASPSRFRWTHHRALYLVIRRDQVAAAIGKAEVKADTLAARLATSPVAPLLREHFLSMSRHMTQLSPLQQAFVLNQAVELALLALVSPTHIRQHPLAPSTLAETAMGYIGLNLRDPALSAEKVAKALGVSRATLYRAFLDQGCGIAEAIRDARLEKARALLEAAARETSVTDIALQCGILDTVNFSRQFRRRFGLAPTDFKLERLSATAPGEGE